MFHDVELLLQVCCIPRSSSSPVIFALVFTFLFYPPLFLLLFLFEVVIVIVILISKILNPYSKAKRTRAPAYSRALRRIKGGFPKGGQEKLRSEFQSFIISEFYYFIIL